MDLKDQSVLMYYSVTVDLWIDHMFSRVLLASEHKVICPIGFSSMRSQNTNQTWSISPTVQQLLLLACFRSDKSVSAQFSSAGWSSAPCKARLVRGAQMKHYHWHTIKEHLYQLHSSTKKGLCQQRHAKRMLFSTKVLQAYLSDTLSTLK